MSFSVRQIEEEVPVTRKSKEIIKPLKFPYYVRKDNL